LVFADVKSTPAQAEFDFYWVSGGECAWVGKSGAALEYFLDGECLFLAGYFSFDDFAVN